MKTVGEALITLLENYDVDTVFGIPGVHTVELYRGLAGSKIKHITPRHEQGAGFMADGYARVSGRPGVVFVITGPGLTNTITAMGQALADSIPMLVISGVNATDTLGKGLGYLHEMPDQQGMMAKVALFSERITKADQLPDALARAFTIFASSRPGPVHIEIPTDVMTAAADGLDCTAINIEQLTPPTAPITEAVQMIKTASRPLILAGGGAKRCDETLTRLAEVLGAPVVLTTNARGLLYRNPLSVPASPCLQSVRALMAESDLVIAFGTEFGPTDYDAYGDGGFRLPDKLIRVDIDVHQLARHPLTIGIQADCQTAILTLLAELGDDHHAAENGAARAELTRKNARAELSPNYLKQVTMVETIRQALPGAIIIGDSTQPVYAANLYYEHDRPAGFFNAATGFGALGYGPAAAIGAALAAADDPIVCLTGDGGFQFTLPELGTAVDIGKPIIFIVWNNHGYYEIETSMLSAGVEPVGVSPMPPDFCQIASAYGVDSIRLTGTEELLDTLKRLQATGKTHVIDITVA